MNNALPNSISVSQPACCEVQKKTLCCLSNPLLAVWRRMTCLAAKLWPLPSRLLVFLLTSLSCLCNLNCVKAPETLIFLLLLAEKINKLNYSHHSMWQNISFFVILLMVFYGSVPSDWELDVGALDPRPPPLLPFFVCALYCWTQ